MRTALKATIKHWPNVPLADIPECGLCCFWLSPTGQAAHVDTGHGGSHSGVAHELGCENGGWDLDAAAYLHVSYGSAFFSYELGDHKPTQEQIDYVFDVRQEAFRRRGMDSSLVRYLDKWLNEVQKEDA